MRSRPGTEDYRLAADWDRRYASASPRNSGTFAHTNAGNIQFYRAKCDALDRCLRHVDATWKGSSVLDAAGGTGEFVRYYLNSGCSRVTIADYSSAAIQIVRNRWLRDTRVTGVVADMTEPSAELLTEPFDFVLVQEAIFHLAEDADLGKTIASLGSYVKRGGYIIISDLFPEVRQVSSHCVVRRPRSQFEALLQSASFRVSGYIAQSAIFNRRIMGRTQILVEQLGPLYYWLNRLAMANGHKQPPHLDIKYLIAQKVEL